MSEERTMILEMVRDGKLGLDDAERLLAALRRPAAGNGRSAGPRVPAVEVGSRRVTAEAAETWTLSREGAVGAHVRTPNGAIAVTAGDGDEIRVSATKQVRGASEAAARDFLEMMVVERRRDGDRWSIVASWPEPREYDAASPQVNLVIELPEGMALEAHSGNGAIHASGTATTTLRTGSGEIRVQEIRGPLHLHTGNGAVEVRECAESVEAQTGSGNITIEQVLGAVKAHTGNGAVKIEECAGDVEIHSGSGSLTLHELPGTVSAHTGNGGIQAKEIGAARLRTNSGDIHVSEVAGDLEARTGNGSVQVAECSGAVQVESGSGRIQGREIQGALQARTGNGAVEVAECSGPAQLESGSGGITAREVAGAVRAKTGNGRIEVAACADALEVNTGSGPIEIHEAPGRVKAHTGNGVIHLDTTEAQGETAIELTGSGRMEVALAAGTSARLEAHTGSGRVELHPESLPRNVSGRGHLEATLGGGKGVVRLRTGHGDISIRVDER